jgi:glycerophosphoryl diester phosphodiesterase
VLTKPLVVAHKGASAYLPGNTLAAFDFAIRQGADCIELDVQLTGDGNIIVYDQWCVEDGDLQRPVIQLSLNSIQQLRSQRRDRNAENEPSDLLTLPEVLSHLKHARVELMIELKNSRLLQPLSLGRRVIDDLNDFAMISRSYLFSYDHELVAAIRSSDIRRGILYVGRLVNIAETLHATRANFIETRNDFLDAEFVTQLHQMDVQICGSSTDDHKEITRLVSLGVDMITTNAPDLARRVIEEAIVAQSD